MAADKNKSQGLDRLKFKCPAKPSKVKLQKNKQTLTRLTSLSTYLNPRITHWLFLVFWVYALFLVVMNLTPGNTQPIEMKKIIFIRSDYFYHATAYIVLISLYILSAYSPRPVFKQYNLAAGITLLILLASIPELLQNFVPRRHFNWWDMLANFTGLTMGAALMLSFRFVFRQHLNSEP
jgi:VanZ family protein